ncbi:uncharacterized protein JCM15063_004868 [Sporobolomyces koalae]|uniref:uncharacterized protein n=1 Tax=Sporobolomyces koalae TaxID=500713 RepID=UPI0031821CE3
MGRRRRFRKTWYHYTIENFNREEQVAAPVMSFGQPGDQYTVEEANAINSRLEARLQRDYLGWMGIPDGMSAAEFAKDEHLELRMRICREQDERKAAIEAQLAEKRIIKFPRQRKAPKRTAPTRITEGSEIASVLSAGQDAAAVPIGKLEPDIEGNQSDIDARPEEDKPCQARAPESKPEEKARRTLNSTTDGDQETVQRARGQNEDQRAEDTSPQSRGFDEDIEPQFCGGFNSTASSRTPFPLNAQGSILIDSHHPSAQVAVLISFDENPTSIQQFTHLANGSSYGLLQNFESLSGEGEFCLSVDIASLNVGATNGTPATIQVEFNGGDGTLFQCADVILVQNYTAPSNVTSSCQSAKTPGSTGSSSASGTASKSVGPSSAVASGSAPSQSAKGQGSGAGSNKIMTGSAIVMGLVGLVAVAF